MKRNTGILVAVSVAVIVGAGIAAFMALEPPLTPPTQPLPDFEGANVVLVTLDTTRADHLGCYGFERAETPHLDRLADEGVLFEQCITPTAYTLPSHSSIMTGLYPPFHGVRLNGGAALADVHTTLAERLADKGYRCGAFVAAFVLDGRWGLKQGFEHYDDGFDIAADERLDLAGVQRPANEVVDSALDWLGEDDDRPFFSWLHLYDPHTPYEPPEPFKTRFGDQGLARLYDGEIAFTDSQVGRVLDWLNDQGLDSNTIVIVAGDHGEALGSHGENYHGYYIYDYAVRVPLLIRLPDPNLRGLRLAQQVRTIDITPTVLDLVGLEASHPIHGQSLVPMISDPGAADLLVAYSESMAVNLQFGWSALYSIRTNDHKFIEAPRSELYDLQNDRGESTRSAGRRSRSRRRPEDTPGPDPGRNRNRGARGARSKPRRRDDVDVGRTGLRGGPSIETTGEDLPDPKDMIHIYQSIGVTAHLMNEKDYEGAIKNLESALAEAPGIPQAQFLLATCYRQTGRTEEAKSMLDQYLRDSPDNTPALIIMAGILSDEGNTDEVMAIAKRVIAADDRNTQAYELMAGVYMGTNNHQEAYPHLQRVVEIQPKLTRNRNNLAACLIGLGRLNEAEVLLNEIIGEYPEFPHSHFHLGLLYEQQGRVQDARQAYANEVEFYPEAFPARFNLGNLLFQLGDTKTAEQQMRTLIDQAPDLPRAYLLLARILLKTGNNLQEVERNAQNGLDRTEEHELKALGYYLLADVYSRQDRQPELRQALEKAQHHRSRIKNPGI